MQRNYPDQDLKQALGAAGALGLIAAEQLIVIAHRHDLIPLCEQRMSDYANV